MHSDLKCWNTPYTTETRVEDDFFDAGLPDIVPGRILDAGCSIGLSTQNLATLYPQSDIWGIDKNRSTISDAYRRLRKLREAGSDIPNRVRFRQQNLYTLSDRFAPDIFEGIFLMNNLTYVASDLSIDNHRAIARGLRTTLSEGGILCISGDSRGNGWANAILKKSGDQFRPLSMNDDFQNASYFGPMAEAYPSN